MGNICGKHQEECIKKPLIRFIVISTNDLFIIPELSPNMEYSIIKNSPKFI